MTIEENTKEVYKQLDKEMQIPVSVALFGQPGAGKSSLINKIVGQSVAEVGVETDKTVDAALLHNSVLLVSDFSNEPSFRRLGGALPKFT